MSIADPDGAGDEGADTEPEPGSRPRTRGIQSPGLEFQCFSPLDHGYIPKKGCPKAEVLKPRPH